MKTFWQRLFPKKHKVSTESEEQHIQEKIEMIEGIEELAETTVKEIMVPRIDVVFLSEDAERDELMQRIADCGHSRFPVYAETIDNVIGILYVKDLLRQLYEGAAEIVPKSIVRKAYFVPESIKLDALLREMKRRRVHIAVVVDEYGGVSGIACLEDILEEIIGDIQDEFDNERDDIVKLNEGVWLCDARSNIDDVNEALETEIPSENFDTLGGFVFDLFGKIPVRYEKVSWEDLDFIIQDMEAHKIKMIKIVKRQEREHESQD